MHVHCIHLYFIFVIKNCVHKIHIKYDLFHDDEILLNVGAGVLGSDVLG